FKNNTLYTSPIELTGVAGIIRSIIIDLAYNHDIQLIEHTFTKDELLSADEIFICNSIIGIWPIKQIANTHFPVNLKTRQIQIWLDRYK
ncbi:MAG: aminotransferase class IV, partial [Methylococcaceae bacterium]|nr:aminotransferase class IV [Methylococcaceae bacterium]